MTRAWRTALAVALGAALGVAGVACATTQLPPEVPVAQARPATLDVVRRAPVQRFLKEAPAVVRSGIARLVTMVPLDEAKMQRLAPALARTFHAERLELETAARLEQALTPEEIEALGAALDGDAVSAVVAAAVAQEPQGAALERFVEDPRALDEGRRARVKALMDVSWSPLVIDRLSRAPVDAAGRCVAAAVHDDDHGRRDELLRLAESGRATDPDALVVAFAFLWRDLDDATLDAAHAYFSSPEGQRATAALVDSALAALSALTDAAAREIAGA